MLAPATPPNTGYAVAFDVHRAQKGVTFWTKREESHLAYFRKLRAKGYDHVGLVFEPRGWMEGRAGEVANFRLVRARIKDALDAGLLVVVRTMPWAMNMTAMWDQKDPAHFDPWLVPFARTIAQFDSNRVAWEFLSEPGWFTRETSKLGVDLDRQRELGTEFLHRVWAHTVPLIRRYAPKHTLFLGLPGWGHSYGANEHLLVQTGRYSNVVHFFHFYWPMDFTHDQTGTLSWPEQNWKEKLRGKDINTIDFAADRKPWTQSVLDYELDKLAQWRNQRGVPIFITEMGPVHNKDLPAGKRYRQALEAGLRARNIPYSIWLGET